MKSFSMFVSGALILLAGVGLGAEKEKVTERDAALRDGPGGYYEVIEQVPKGARVSTGEVKGGWVSSRTDKAAGWLAEMAFQKPRAGIDYSGMLEKSTAMTISSADIAAATKGVFTATYSEKHKVDFAAADRLAEHKINSPLILRLKTPLSPGNGAALRSKVSSRPFNNTVVVRPDAEALLGRALVARLISDGLVEKPELVDYVNAVAAILGEQTERYDMTYRVGILNSAEIGGFGLPGGYILITRGLLECVKDEAELACILGHEMAHISLYHGLREFDKREVHRKRDTMFSELDASSTDHSASAAEDDLNKLADTAYLKIIGGRAREDELEADLFGALYAAAAGYDPQAMTDVLTRIEEQSSSRDAFKHHPSVDQRLEELRKMISRHKLKTSSQQRLAERYAVQAAPGRE